MGGLETLDLFSAAAGGWSLGLHRAGFTTIAACEAIDWRRTLYAQNNPGVPIYDDVRTLTAARLLADLGRLPGIIVGSPPCQDISSANTKGKGVEGERSGLFFEAVRLIGECRPRWFALENSANLRTRGADAVLAALEALDYTCWALVVRAGNIGANHERPRSWIIGCDTSQVIDAARVGHEGGRPRRYGSHGHDAPHPRYAAQDGCGSGFPRGCAEPVARPQFEARGDAPHADSYGEHAQSKHGEMAIVSGLGADREPGNTPHPDQAGQADGRMVASLRQAEITDDGCGDRRGDDGSGIGQMAVRAPDSGGAATGEPLWSLADLAGRLRLDDGLPARLAGTRVAVGGPRGTSAASLIVEAYGDAVVPQIPEAIGKAILRVEKAIMAVAK